MEKNEENTVKKIRSTEQILVLAILLFTYFLETFQVAYAQKAENLPQIVSWQDGKGYQSDGTFIADGWGYDTVNPAGKYVLFDENGMAVFTAEKARKKGDKVTLKNALLYASSTAKSGVKKTGTFYLYDGVEVNGRYRITTKAGFCGRTPIGKYVTGWVEKKDI